MKADRYFPFSLRMAISSEEEKKKCLEAVSGVLNELIWSFF